MSGPAYNRLYSNSLFNCQQCENAGTLLRKVSCLDFSNRACFEHIEPAKMAFYNEISEFRLLVSQITRNALTVRQISRGTLWIHEEEARLLLKLREESL